jgi:hypothetical protein
MQDSIQELMEYEPEMGGYASQELEFSGDSEFYEASGQELPFGEMDEMELTAALLEVNSDAELDQFLGNLMQKAGRAVGSFVRSPTGQALGGILRGAAKKALPIVGRAVGGYLGGPGTADTFAKAAGGLGRSFGLELEGLSQEDQEFEVGRRFVRFAGAAAQKAALSPPNTPPQTAAQSAALAAAKQHAPGLLRPAPGAAVPTPGVRQSGRWIRRGRKIVLLNC